MGLRYIYSVVGCVFAIVGGTLFVQNYPLVGAAFAAVGVAIVLFQIRLMERGRY